ncbi:hypothetical protein SAMD00019534_003110, partial [Acytostelium subglobosum LB1]|uniref:hypothetical protein n=1 Tax=Acytostelium subglobosum LB1 TaxID=1410327 RepID=UPI0006449F0A
MSIRYTIFYIHTFILKVLLCLTFELTSRIHLYFFWNYQHSPSINFHKSILDSSTTLGLQWFSICNTITKINNKLSTTSAYLYPLSSGRNNRSACCFNPVLNTWICGMFRPLSFFGCLYSLYNSCLSKYALLALMSLTFFRP